MISFMSPITRWYREQVTSGSRAMKRRSSSLRAGRRRVFLPTETLEVRRLLVGDIAGTLLSDTNGNGIKDPGEEGLVGWTVYVDANNNNSLDTGEVSTQTNVDGDYLITGIAKGTWSVREVLPAGWAPSPGTSDVLSVNVVNGGEARANFFNGTAQVGSISGLVWNDYNGDGVRAVSEPGLSGWTIYLDLNNNNAKDPTDLAVTTDANGNYLFAVVASGEYQLREVLPTGWNTSIGYDNNQTVFVTTGNESVVDFANFTPEAGSISGTIFDDTDGNGVRATDPSTGAFTEPGLAGWQVYLDSNGDGALTAGEPAAVSDANGDYTIYGVAYGTSTIREVTSPDWTPTAPTSASYSVNLLNGEIATGYDFGNHERRDASIGGTIFADTNHNGTRDAGEHGLAGITVYLDLDNDGAMDDGEPSLTTSSDLYYTPSVDEAGTYSFSRLAKGTYSIREIVPDLLSSTPVSEAEHTVTVSGAQTLTGVDSGNVFRPNELHGVKFNDTNSNHVQDAGEAGLGGTTVYLDLNRNNVLDASEPSTVTAADGSYSFKDLTPGAYVVREVESEGFSQTFPLTTDGTLWPAGTSNPAIGNVTPGSITTSLADGQTYRTTVSITLPDSGALTNMVDVFLLFDDTGSFTGNSPIVRSAFPEIITSLQTALPGIDLGFGVGRFEEYGSYAGEDPSGRPFILNQPIVAATTSGFSTSIQSALDRTAPGYGGDTPETDIEALYQLVTGAGFDGNNNGTVLDSGAAGLVSTQVTPGSSGDVPSFASFTADTSGNVLPAAGNIGGAGFRSGALPIVLLATDTGIAYQPKGETAITGVSGLTLPLSDLTQSSRSDTPFNSGAGIQETVTGLNALGALVIGLGTNPDVASDPRRDMEALAKLTGATNQSTTTIANGTSDAIAPGDPFYFQIASGFSASVANGITTAIQNAVTNVAVNMTVRASDPRVQIINHTGTLSGVKAGDTASFDIEFVGNGIPRRFDLQFVREGTNVVLGSIPVVIGTPIPGNGYAFEELEDGEIASAVDFGSTLDQVAPVVTAITPSVPQLQNADTEVFNVAFSKSVSNVTVDDFQLTTTGSVNGIISDVTGSGSTYSITVSGISGDGTLRLDLKDATDVQDANGNVAAAFNTGDVATVSHPVDVVINLSETGGTYLVSVDASGLLHVTQSGTDLGTPALPALLSNVTSLTINGGAGADYVSLTPSLTGFSGSFTFNGNGGNDTLVASQMDFATTFNGGAGDDSFAGGSGNDTVIGGTGNDTMFGGTGTDLWVEAGVASLRLQGILVRGSLGKDRLVDFEAARISGTGGSDSLDLSSAAFPVTLLGGNGNDSLIGGTAGDLLLGGNGNDTLLGLDGNDLLRAGSGKDSLDGGTGDDMLLGESGNDTLTSAGGNDVLVGGDGNDRLTVTGSGQSLLIGGHGRDILTGGDGEDILIGGFTSFDASTAALLALEAEWSRVDQTYGQRIGHLRGTRAHGANGRTLLDPTTVFDDAIDDVLSGAASLDWFWGLSTETPDRVLGEKLN